jgi:GT2 family glycosyltransferase
MAYAGWERWVVPAAVIVHYGGQSTAQAPTRSFTQLWKSRARLYQRYHSPALNALARLVVQAGLRRQIRANFQRAQRGEITPEYRAAINLALTETLKAWTPKRRI